MYSSQSTTSFESGLATETCGGAGAGGAFCEHALTATNITIAAGIRSITTPSVAASRAPLYSILQCGHGHRLRGRLRRQRRLDSQSVLAVTGDAGGHLL